MMWKKLLVPFIVVLTFMGFAGYMGILRVFHGAWKKKPLLCVLLLEVTVVSIFYLLFRSTLISLDFLELWIDRDTGSCVAFAHITSLFRLTILPLTIWLVGERYLAIQKPAFHTRIDNVRSGVVITVLSALFTGILVSVLVLMGRMGSECHPGNENGQMATRALECTLALFVFVVSGCCMSKQRASTRTQNSVNSVFPLGICISLSSVCVCGLQLLSSSKMLRLSVYSQELKTTALLIDSISFSLFPIVVFLGEQSIMICIAPSWFDQPQTREQETIVRTTQTDLSTSEQVDGRDTVQHLITAS